MTFDNNLAGVVIANKRIQISATVCGATLSLSGIIKISSIEAGGGQLWSESTRS